MVPPCINLLNFDSICEDFNRLLSMHVKRVGDAELAILVEASGEDAPSLCQEQRVELPSCDLLNRLSVKVGVVAL